MLNGICPTVCNSGSIETRLSARKITQLKCFCVVTTLLSVHGLIEDES